MPGLLDEAMAVGHRPNIQVLAGDSHYGCAPMVEGLRARNLHLVRWMELPASHRL